MKNILHNTSILFRRATRRLGRSRVAQDLRRSPRHRWYASLMLVLFLASTTIAALQPLMPVKAYAMDTEARRILPAQNKKLAAILEYDYKKASFEYNAGYTGQDVNSDSSARITASIAADPRQGMEINDPVNQLSMKLKPKYDLGPGRQDGNQIHYPLADRDGYLVYTAQAAGIKEDILLAKYTKDKLRFDYDIELAKGLVAKLEPNGALGIYGSDSPIFGSVSTGSDKDKELLEKARNAADKNKLMFTVPAPVVVEANKTVSNVKARFVLEGISLSIVAENLGSASYPLSIDPSVYVETAQKLMRGNNETNIDFDTTNELIQKGELTGGRFDNWLNSLSLPASRHKMGTAAAGGYIYSVGGTQGTTRVSTVYWAKLNTSTRAIEATNPGAGACASWCTNSAYDLPVATAGMSMVAYNGYLYVFGGETSTGRTNAVYISKLGANGEPSLWHPTDTNSNNWVYWHQAGNLSSERVYTAAAAYNNRMYLVGGQTNASAGGVTTVEVANINPIGTLSNWSSTGMVAIPTARRSHNIQIYNDRMYLIGGISSVAAQSSVQYIRINNDGTLAGSWVTTKDMTSARFSDGGNFSAIVNGYLYVAGGCSAVTGAGNWCSVAGASTARDIALASINADGSITNWDTIGGLQQTRTGYGLVAWRKTLYGIGGCTAPNDATGACTTDTSVANYGAINKDGDVSTTDNSVASGVSPCSGTSPTSCDIPPAGDNAGQGGRMANGVVMNNGFIYIIGGCTDISTVEECNIGNNGQMSGNISFAAFASDGSLVRPAVCAAPKTFSGSWCVDSTNRLNGTAGLGATGATVFNNTIYAASGTTGDRWNEFIWRVGLNEDGSLTGAWTSQQFSTVGLGGIGRGFMFSFARANPSSAGTNPGNLYIIGGCNGGSERSDGIVCTTYFSAVYKCNITTTGAIGANSCTTTGQLQLDSEPGGTAQGLSNMAGVVYANYIYLVGGASPNQSARGTIMYAKIDNSNNIVAADGGSIWITSGSVISPARQRGAAFGYNGYLYSLAGYSGSGSLNDVLYAKIDVSNGSIGTWTTSQVTVTPRWQLGAIVANGFVYAFGGCGTGAAPAGCTALTGSIQTFQLYNNYSGSPAGYTAGNTIGDDRIGGSSVVQDGYIYYVGGCSVIACTTATNTVYYAPLNPDGTIGTWASAANTLPDVRAWGKLLSQGGTLYYIGGQDSAGTAQSTVYYSTPVSGIPATWNATTNPLPAARSELSGSIWDGRLFITGGHTGGVRQNSVYASPELPNGGDISASWITTNGFNVARSGHSSFVYSNNLYVVGGSDGTNYMSDVQFAKLDPLTGAVTNWTYSASLPQKVYQADAYAANGYLYVFGGRSATAACTNNTYVTPISANTTIASGNNPTGIGDWSQTNVKFTGARYGAAVAYDQGKAYVLGGGCAAFVASGDRTYVTALQSQPAVAKYSRMIDTDTDVFPTKWLMNGLDNDVGARWQMKYRSSTNATAAWGQETNYGTVTLGTPDNYIPLDGSGVNTSFGRYFYLSISIDSSKAFGYPDDVSRGPTVDDISLFFTSDPSKRLRHGATFTGGQLQPLDTPFP
jgi:N-acetylneuraminic acid mutarotase